MGFFDATLDDDTRVGPSFFSGSADPSRLPDPNVPRIEDESTLMRGLRRGMSNSYGMLQGAGAQLLEPLAPEAAASQFNEARGTIGRAAQNYPRRIETFDQAKGVGDVLEYAGDAFMENVPNLGLVMAGGLGGRALALRNGLSGGLGSTLAGGAGAVMPLEAGEQALRMQADPQALANTTPWERLGLSAGKGAINAMLEAAPEAIGINSILKPAAGGLIRGVGRGAALGAVAEGPLTEAPQEMVAQYFHTLANPQRDTTHDAAEVKEAAIRGAMAGAPIGGIYGGVQGAMGYGDAALDAAAPTAKKGFAKVQELAGNAVDGVKDFAARVDENGVMQTAVELEDQVRRATSDAVDAAGAKWDNYTESRDLRDRIKAIETGLDEAGKQNKSFDQAQQDIPFMMDLIQTARHGGVEFRPELLKELASKASRAESMTAPEVAEFHRQLVSELKGATHRIKTKGDVTAESLQERMNKIFVANGRASIAGIMTEDDRDVIRKGFDPSVRDSNLDNTIYNAMTAAKRVNKEDSQVYSTLTKVAHSIAQDRIRGPRGGESVSAYKERMREQMQTLFDYSTYHLGDQGILITDALSGFNYPKHDKGEKRTKGMLNQIRGRTTPIEFIKGNLNDPKGKWQDVIELVRDYDELVDHISNLSGRTGYSRKTANERKAENETGTYDTKSPLSWMPTQLRTQLEEKLGKANPTEKEIRDVLTDELLFEIRKKVKGDVGKTVIAARHALGKGLGGKYIEQGGLRSIDLTDVSGNTSEFATWVDEEDNVVGNYDLSVVQGDPRQVGATGIEDDRIPGGWQEVPEQAVAVSGRANPSNPSEYGDRGDWHRYLMSQAEAVMSRGTARTSGQELPRGMMGNKPSNERGGYIEIGTESVQSRARRLADRTGTTYEENLEKLAADVAGSVRDDIDLWSSQLAEQGVDVDAGLERAAALADIDFANQQTARQRGEVQQKNDLRKLINDAYGNIYDDKTALALSSIFWGRKRLEILEDKGAEHFFEKFKYSFHLTRNMGGGQEEFSPHEIDKALVNAKQAAAAKGAGPTSGYITAVIKGDEGAGPQYFDLSKLMNWAVNKVRSRYDTFDDQEGAWKVGTNELDRNLKVEDENGKLKPNMDYMTALRSAWASTVLSLLRSEQHELTDDTAELLANPPRDLLLIRGQKGAGDIRYGDIVRTKVVTFNSRKEGGGTKRVEVDASNLHPVQFEEEDLELAGVISYTPVKERNEGLRQGLVTGYFDPSGKPITINMPALVRATGAKLDVDMRGNISKPAAMFLAKRGIDALVDDGYINTKDKSGGLVAGPRMVVKISGATQGLPTLSAPFKSLASSEVANLKLFDKTVWRERSESEVKAANAENAERVAAAGVPTLVPDTDQPVRDKKAAVTLAPTDAADAYATNELALAKEDQRLAKLAGLAALIEKKIRNLEQGEGVVSRKDASTVMRELEIDDLNKELASAAEYYAGLSLPGSKAAAKEQIQAIQQKLVKVRQQAEKYSVTTKGRYAGVDEGGINRARHADYDQQVERSENPLTTRRVQDDLDKADISVLRGLLRNLNDTIDEMSGLNEDSFVTDEGHLVDKFGRVYMADAGPKQHAPQLEFDNAGKRQLHQVATDEDGKALTTTDPSSRDFAPVERTRTNRSVAPVEDRFDEEGNKRAVDVTGVTDDFGTVRNPKRERVSARGVAGDVDSNFTGTDDFGAIGSHGFIDALNKVRQKTTPSKQTSAPTASNTRKADPVLQIAIDNWTANKDAHWQGIPDEAISTFFKTAANIKTEAAQNAAKLIYFEARQNRNIDPVNNRYISEEKKETRRVSLAAGIDVDTLTFSTPVKARIENGKIVFESAKSGKVLGTANATAMPALQATLESGGPADIVLTKEGSSLVAEATIKPEAKTMSAYTGNKDVVEAQKAVAPKAHERIERKPSTLQTVPLGSDIPPNYDKPFALNDSTTVELTRGGKLYELEFDDMLYSRGRAVKVFGEDIIKALERVASNKRIGLTSDPADLKLTSVENMKAAKGGYDPTPPGQKSLKDKNIRSDLKEKAQAFVNTKASVLGTNAGMFEGSSEDVQEAINVINRIFNGKQKLEIHDALSQMFKGKERNVGGLNFVGKSLIQLSAAAKGHVTSNAYHEALHTLVGVLQNSEQGKATMERLFKALTTKAMMSRMERVLKEHVGEKHAAEIMAEANADREEAAAYAFQLWAMGVLKVGPETQGIFHQIANFLRRLFNLTSEAVRAENFMTAFASGELGRADFKETAMSKAFGETANDKIIENINKNIGQPVMTLLRTVFDSTIEAMERLDSQHARDLIHMYAGRGENGGFIHNKAERSRLFATRAQNQLFGVFKKDELRAGLSEVFAGKNDSAAAKAIRAYIDEINAYTGKPAGTIPTIWDNDKITKNKEEFENAIKDFGVKDDSRVLDKELLEIMANLGYGDVFSDKPKMDFLPEYGEQKSKWLQSDPSTFFRALISRSTDFVEGEKALGKGRFKAKEALRALREEKGEAAYNRARDVVDGWEGTLGANMSPHVRAAMNAAITVGNVVTLPFMIFSAAIDPFHVAARSSNLSEAFNAYLRGLSSIPKTVFEGFGGKTKADQWQQFAEDAAVIEHAMLTDSLSDIYLGDRQTGFFKGVNDWYFKANFADGWTRQIRTAAAAAANRFIIAHRNGNETRHSAHYLEELGLKPEDIKLREDGKLDVSDEKIRNAVNHFVYQAVVRPDSTTNAVWMNDQRFALLAHMKKFTFAFHRQIIDRTMTELGRGNASPLLNLLPSVGMIVAADGIKHMIKGDYSTWMQGKSFLDWLSYAVERSGLTGRAQFGLDALTDIERGGTPVDSFLGPEYGLVKKGFDAHGEYSDGGLLGLADDAYFAKRTADVVQTAGKGQDTRRAKT